MKKFPIIGLLVLLASLIIYSGSLFDFKLSTSHSLNNSIRTIFSGKDGLEERIELLETENRHLNSLLNEGVEREDSIKVYSSHPFNSRGEIAIAAGRNRGIETGDVVVYSGNILVGQVRSVFEYSSIVTTIFDSSWEVQARIGESEIDALMQGGNEPKMTLIPKDEHIQAGDIVLVAGKNFPYGLELGFVGETNDVSGDVFQEAILEPSFKVKDLRDVSIYH